MRRVLVGWMGEVAVEYRLKPATLFQAVNLVDRFLTIESISKKHLQLAGCAALLLASKFEEVEPPIPSDFAYISDNTYTVSQVV